MDIWNLLETPDLLLERQNVIVEKWEQETLTPIIKNEIKTGTTIYSNQWKGYSTLNLHGYIHQTVNHSKFFIGPETGATGNQKHLRCICELYIHRVFKSYHKIGCNIFIIICIFILYVIHSDDHQLQYVMAVANQLQSTSFFRQKIVTHLSV